MFPFQNFGDLPFQTPDIIVGEEENMVENQTPWPDVEPAGLESMNIDDLSNRGGRRRGRGRGRGRARNSADNAAGPSNFDVNDDEEEEQKRKTIRREFERQRRQEMTNLYSSLRSEIPDEHIKGKRSTSDCVAGAVNYIKDLEKNVKELGKRKDQLRATPEWTIPTFQEGGSSNPRPRPGSVVINPCLGGLNIEIDVGYEDESFSLSSALQVLYEEGISVSSCTSTKANERMVHNIICEVTDITWIDFSRLQQRLFHLVS